MCFRFTESLTNQPAIIDVFEDSGRLNSQSKKPTSLATVRTNKTTAQSINSDQAMDTLDQDKSALSTPFDANMYATKRTFAKGCLNIAVLTSNATQLKFMVKFEEAGKDNLYYPVIVLLSLSILLQIVTAIMCLMVGNRNINNEGKRRDQAEKLNNAISALTLLTTIINMLVTSLGVGEIKHTPKGNGTVIK